jgi:hypothetical protein
MTNLLILAKSPSKSVVYRQYIAALNPCEPPLTVSGIRLAPVLGFALHCTDVKQPFKHH